MAQQWLSLVAIAASLPVVVQLSNVLHEVGHALAALAVGYRVRGFVVRGTSADFTRSGGFLQFGRRFGKAAAVIAPRRGWISGWRGMVAYAGGVVANALVVVLTAPATGTWVRSHGVSPGVHTVVSVITVSFFCVNAFQVVANLVPRVLSTGAVSDGKHLLNLLHSRRLVEWIKVAESSTVVDCPRELLWQFLDNPDNTTRYDTTAERAYQKPGTPAFVGRIVVIQHRPTPSETAGAVYEKEIIEYEPPRRVMARSTKHHFLRGEILLRALGPGTTRLTQTVWIGTKPLAPEQRQRLLDRLAEVGPRLSRENDAISHIFAAGKTEVLTRFTGGKKTEILTRGTRGRRDQRGARTR
ncbi:hypothetical protein I6A84_04700 [Frankia sp. CNm7]|uniref:Uncharacterized protein n=1 Tax=Frankia nepalensis TaxID=1836974 RepID=A0A937RMG0_9ACTN|nr:hypothetical protein [Frankia nepalensis]MBL7499976.1 hypothetical protein [Frankia nepalensis]MBL7512509.1 hypothetical protein [Frankia nepalensis]MBL7517438.1 hypothetical protein [Frankia nepalensis]MBL7632812.1 hypothetical protein [Frankia nepalensis]